MTTTSTSEDSTSALEVGTTRTTCTTGNHLSVFISAPERFMDVPACKLFSIQEANSLVPYLEESLETLQQRVGEIVGLKRQLEVLNLICNNELTHDNPDFQEYTDKTGLYHQLIGEADGLIREIRSKGCLLRDVHAGIVDFYCRYNGRVVYLCWRKGEKQMAHWHPIGEGFGKRRPLTAEPKPAPDSKA